MEPTRELADALYQEEVERARRMPPGEKLFAPAELFDMACEMTMAGIRHQFPEADEAEVFRILRERLELSRRMENNP